MQRRDAFKSILATLTSLATLPAWAKRLSATPAQTEGPFYPEQNQLDRDIDLTRIEGHTERAQGDVIYVRGRVLNTNGDPIDNAKVEIWQANTYGRYAHSRDSNNAPLDQNFQGWGIAKTNVAGEYGFKTILPGAYPASSSWTRPPHIHFKISHNGYRSLTTQLYFPEQKLNETDLILQGLTKSQQGKVTARLKNKVMNHFEFEIVLG